MNSPERNQRTCEKLSICMLVYGYFPASSGGAENQCRLQSHELVRRGYRCIVLTARTSRSLPRFEIDQGCEIVRLSIVQPLIDVLLWFTRICRQENTGTKPDCAEKNFQAADNQGNSCSSIVAWLNVLLYLFGATIYLFRHRHDIDIIHTHGCKTSISN